MKRILSLIMTIALIFGMMIVPAFAGAPTPGVITNYNVTCSGGVIAITGAIGTTSGTSYTVTVYEGTAANIIYVNQFVTGVSGSISVNIDSDYAVAGKTYVVSVNADGFTALNETKTFVYTAAVVQPTPTPDLDTGDGDGTTGGGTTGGGTTGGGTTGGGTTGGGTTGGGTTGGGTTGGGTQTGNIPPPAPEVKPVVEVAKSTVAADTAVSGAASAIETIKNSTTPITQEQTKQVATNLSAMTSNLTTTTDQNKIASNASTVAAALTTTTELLKSGNITTAQKAELTTNVLNTLEATIASATKVTSDANIAVMADTLKKLIGSTANLLSTSTDATTNSQIAVKTEEALKALTTNAKLVTGTNQTVNLQVLDAISNAVVNASNSVAVTTAVTDKKAVVAQTTEALKAAGNLLNSITDTTKAIAVVKNIATAATSMVSNSAALGNNDQLVKNEVMKLAASVVAKLGKETVTSTTVGNKTTSEVSTAQVASLLDKASKVSAAATDLNTGLQGGGIGKVEKAIAIDIPTTSASGALGATLPADLLSGVSGVVDKVAITSGVANISVAPDFIPASAMSGEAAKVNLEVGTTPVTDDLKANMSPEQRLLLADTGKIFDFNASVSSGANTTKVSEFTSKVKIDLPYELAPGESKDKITILYLADDGTVKNMIGKYNPETKKVSFETDHFSKYIIKNYVKIFKDVASKFWAKDNIESMASKGVIDGTSADKYDPNENVTREQFAKMVTTALNIVDTKATASFKDVKKTDWSYSYIASAVKAGLITGMSDGTFAPKKTISRQEMAVILSRALVNVNGETKAKDVAAYTGFADKSKISSYAVEGIATAVKYELLTGKPGNKVDPTGTLTRAEAAAVIYRLFNQE